MWFQTLRTLWMNKRNQKEKIEKTLQKKFFTLLPWSLLVRSNLHDVQKNHFGKLWKRSLFELSSPFPFSRLHWHRAKHILKGWLWASIFAIAIMPIKVWPLVWHVVLHTIIKVLLKLSQCHIKGLPKNSAKTYGGVSKCMPIHHRHWGAISREKQMKWKGVEK